MKFLDRLNLLPMWAIRLIGVVLFIVIAGAVALGAGYVVASFFKPI